MDNEQIIIEKILAGDIDQFRYLVEKYQRLIQHIVFRMVTNQTDREEICQEIFVKVYENLAKFKFQSKFSTWIGKIAFNTSINFLKKSKTPLYHDVFKNKEQDSDGMLDDRISENLLSITSDQPDQITTEKDISRIIQKTINHLPKQYQTMITLFHIDNLTYQEIGEILNLPEGTVKSYLFRARKLLKDKLLEVYQLEELWGP